MITPKTITSLSGRSSTSSSSYNDTSSSDSDSSTSSEKQDISSLPKETTSGHFESGQQLPRDKKMVGNPALTFPETVRTLTLRFIVTYILSGKSITSITLVVCFGKVSQIQ
jgi:hypothetical protein